MSAPKKGDRVWVEFEGVVQARSLISGLCTIKYEDCDSTFLFESVPDEICRVLAPPVKVGDVVTAENIGQLPDRSVIGVPGSVPLWRLYGQWHPSANSDPTEIGAVILRIGSGS